MFYFHPLLAKDSHFDDFFQMGWFNHQAVYIVQNPFFSIFQHRQGLDVSISTLGTTWISSFLVFDVATVAPWAN